MFMFGLRQGGEAGGAAESLALLQALCHLHGGICRRCGRLSTEEGRGSLRLVALDLFAWGIGTDARDEHCYALAGFSIFI